MYDRFNNKFRYVLVTETLQVSMTRTSIVAYPWFSPAGQQRGILNNAVKLAYNPIRHKEIVCILRESTRLLLNQDSELTFGDKTALGYASAFDRINVRRLFLTVEQALQRAAEAQLFELNDELTRANFKNIVRTIFLRDVQAKRGIYGFLVVCDTSNNTPDVIDNNEFRADIFLKACEVHQLRHPHIRCHPHGRQLEEGAGRV